jgi:hypothetical protein
MNEIVFPLLTMCAEPMLWRSSASSENQFLVPLLLGSPGTADVAKMFFSSASLRRDGRQGSESTPNILSSLTICSIFLKVGEGFLLLVNFSLAQTALLLRKHSGSKSSQLRRIKSAWHCLLNTILLAAYESLLSMVVWLPLSLIIVVVSVLGQSFVIRTKLLVQLTSGLTIFLPRKLFLLLSIAHLSQTLRGTYL